MSINLVSMLTRRISFASLGLFGLAVLYVALSFAGFYRWVQPSLDGRSDRHIGADSTTYISYAKTLRDGGTDPFVLAAMASFPNTLWAPVSLALAIPSPLVMALVNYLMFALSVFILKREFSFSTGLFVSLLLLNATTAISLLSVNKEIIDLLAISLFLSARMARKKSLLFLALLIALVSRYEVCAMMLAYMVVQSRVNPWREKRKRTIFLFILVISVLLPLFGSTALAARFEEATGGGIVTFLDSLEIHYLYTLAVFPKIAENLFAELLNFSKWADYSTDDPAGSYIIFFNNLANVLVLALLFRKRRLTIQNDLVYFALLGSVLMAISLVIQPRYFYSIYVLLCLQAAETPAGSGPLFHDGAIPAQQTFHT